ncbi:MAG TPA: hypothetical protein VGL97_16445 [Bryobacteraceae bacterium]|jgi:hypothetical protein
MPKLPPFALAQTRPAAKRRPQYLVVFLFLFAIPLFVVHLQLVTLPFFWDEHGQFIPTALDLLRHGEWVARSTVPNIHPPGVEAYLAIWYRLFGYSIPLTRVAMLAMASFGLLFTFLLAIELSHGTSGAPAFLPPLLLLASPLFYTQSMMAQLDMPAMVFSMLALLLFVKQKYAWAAAASVALVLMKETGLVVPFVFFVVLVLRRDWKRAAFFAAPALALAGWLAVLHGSTGYWMGDPGFAHYNVGYALHPVRMTLSFARRIYYLFFGEFRWIGTLILAVTITTSKAFRTPAWTVAAAVAAGTTILVSVLGGAELERYLLPVLPIFYIAVSVGLASLPKIVSVPATLALLAGLAANLFWNPPYPFPYENNYAMVDFVRLEQLAGHFAESNLRNDSIATAWPYTSALKDPDFGFVTHKLNVVETNDFHAGSIRSLAPNSFDALITYSRTWAPKNGAISIELVRRFLRRFYQWEPDITAEQCEELGLHEVVSWSLRGQTMTVYERASKPHL